MRNFEEMKKLKIRKTKLLAEAEERKLLAELEEEEVLAKLRLQCAHLEAEKKLSSVHHV